MTRVAFIGLGNMGAPMAQNLLKAGFKLSVFDLVAESVAQLVNAGASAASSASDAVKDADVVITMLPASKHVEGIYLGSDGLLAKIPSKALIIDCSTIAADSARKVAAAASLCFL